MPQLSNDISDVPEGFEKTGLGMAGGVSHVGSGFESRSYPERYDLLEKAMAEAVREDVISPLPISQPQHKSAYAVSRLKTIRKRLYMLGYLKRNSGQANLGPKLEAAIMRFQQESKLVVTDFGVDGWVGEESWMALQELVSFETPSNLKRWFDDQGKPCPALTRAVHLRLYAFGLCPTPPAYGAPDDNEVARGLNLFAKLSHGYFHFSDQPSDQPVAHDICFDTVNLLMNQDELIGCLAEAAPLVQAKGSTPDLQHPQLLDYACRFVINITKAELWMLGYEQVAPAGFQAADSRRAVASSYELRGNLFAALRQFWIDQKDNAHAVMKAKQHVTKYFHLFFQNIHATLSVDASEMHPDSDVVFQKLHDAAHKNQDENMIQKVWHELRSIGSRIWDGLKRAWHWLATMVKKGVTWLKNLTRLAYNYILKSFESARCVVSGVVGTLTFFADRELQFPWQGLGVKPVLRMARDGDFDFRTMVDVTANAPALDCVSSYLETKASIFAISCRMFAALLDMVIDLIKHTIFSGWAVLMMALLKLYNIIKAFAPQILAFARVEQRMLEAG